MLAPNSSWKDRTAGHHAGTGWWDSRARRPWERQAGHAVILLSHPEHLTVLAFTRAGEGMGVREKDCPYKEAECLKPVTSEQLALSRNW